jgi:PAS domain S-box-containing protein
MPINEPEVTGLAETRALLAEIASALLTSTPKAHAAIVPSPAKQECEHSQVREADEGVIILDEYGTILEFNEAAEQIFGHARHGVLGQDATVLFLTLPGEEQPALRIGTSCGQKDKTLSFAPHVLGWRRNCTTLPLDLRISELCLDGERRFLVLVSDLTEQRKREQGYRTTLAGYLALIHGMLQMIKVITGKELPAGALP